MFSTCEQNANPHTIPLLERNAAAYLRVEYLAHPSQLLQSISETLFQ